jgi:hypothetical protein
LGDQGVLTGGAIDVSLRPGGPHSSFAGTGNNTERPSHSQLRRRVKAHLAARGVRWATLEIDGV